MLTIKYLIRNATNLLWYTENHDIPMSDRWTPNILDAHQYDSITAAETEIENDDHGLDIFNIFEVRIRS
jgi:hypothetical protein